MDPPVPEGRWLAYHYTKLGRWTYVGQWTLLQYQKRDDLHTTTQNLADKPTLTNGPPSTRKEMTCIPLHKTQQMTYVGQWTLPQYQRRDDLHTTTQNLADKLTLTNGPPSTRGEMTCIPLHKTQQMNLHWPMDPPTVPEERWLAYHYTKLGRWTYVGQWTLPRYQKRDDLHTTTQNLADEPTLANGPPSTRKEMTCIWLHKTWQMNLHWPMDPPTVPEERWLAYHYTKLGRWTYVGQWTLPQYQKRDDFHTTTQNLADEPTLANGPPSTRKEMTCIRLHKTWQMNLHWPMDPPTVPEERWLAYHYTKLGRWTYFGQWTLPQYQRRDDLHTTTQNSADDLCWPMDPPTVPEERWLAYHYTKFGRQTDINQWPPSTRKEITCIPLQKTWQMNLHWPMELP